jgi:hypothetical protein
MNFWPGEPWARAAQQLGSRGFRKERRTRLARSVSAMGVLALLTASGALLAISFTPAARGSAVAVSCRPFVDSPHVVRRGDAMPVRYRVCKPGTVRFWVVGLCRRSRAHRGGAAARRTVSITEPGRGQITINIGAMGPGVYRLTMGPASGRGQRVHAAHTLVVVYRSAADPQRQARRLSRHCRV